MIPYPPQSAQRGRGSRAGHTRTSCGKSRRYDKSRGGRGECTCERRSPTGDDGPLSHLTTRFAMSHLRRAVLAFGFVVAAGVPARADDAADAKALVEKAVKAHGGQEK